MHPESRLRALSEQPDPGSVRVLGFCDKQRQAFVQYMGAVETLSHGVGVHMIGISSNALSVRWFANTSGRWDALEAIVTVRPVRRR